MYFVEYLDILYNCDHILKIEKGKNNFCRVTFIDGTVITLHLYEVRKLMMERNENKDVQVWFSRRN